MRYIWRMIIIEEEFICTLASDICKCCYRKEELCLNKKDGCGFREEKKIENKEPSYIRQKRWYEDIRKPNRG